MAGSKAVEGVALEKLPKASEIVENLRKEVDAEKAPSAALLLEVNLLWRQLEEAKALGFAAAEAYSSALAGFGGVTPPVPAIATAANLFSWMSANFAKLLEFAGKATDFAALSSATNFAKNLASAGCTHLRILGGRRIIRS